MKRIALLALCFSLNCLALPEDYDPQDSMYIMASVALERANRKITPLTSDMGLLCAAQIQALDMAKNHKCSHKSRYGISFMVRAKKCGTILTLGTELIGCRREFSITQMLISHKNQRALLNPGYDKMGCDTYGKYWVCIFGH